MDGQEATDLKAHIFYYARRKYYNLMLNACKAGISKFKSDISFHLYHSLALLLNNRIEECINEFVSIKSENDVRLAAVIALMYAHKLIGVTNKDLFIKLDSQMRELRKCKDALDFYHSSFVLFLLSRPQKAAEYVEKALSIKPNLLDVITLKGWILLNLKQTGSGTTQNVIECFETVLKNDRRNLDASLGLAEAYLFHGNIDEAINTVNKAVVRFPHTQIPLLEKMKILFAAQDWSQTIETMNRVIDENKDELEAMKINLLILLCRDANYDEATLCLKKYINILNVKEGKNDKILLENAQLFSRICGRNEDVLNETLKMLEKCVQINAEDVNLVTELGYQCLLLGQTNEARKYYQTATRINDSSLKALMGLSFCKLSENGPMDQIRKQLEYLLELEEAQNCAQLYFLRAKVAENSEDSLKFLKHAADLQLHLVKSLPYSDTYLLLLDPDFMLQIAKEYLQYVSCITNFSNNNTKNTSPLTITVQNILKLITKSCPGLQEALYLLAKMQFITGDMISATQNLEKILNKIDDKFSDAHLLMAQIYIQKGEYERAAQNLEVGLSHNFKVRENPLYHFIHGIISKKTDNLQDAISSLTTSLNLIEVNPEATSNKLNGQVDITLSERASIYIELIDAHNSIAQTDEALKLLEDALNEFHGTPEEPRILILSAEHAVRRHNIQHAIDLLNKIKPSDSSYIQARKKLADIMLKYRMDRYAYLECYKEMITEDSNAESYVLLGDAYMTILEPDEALQSYTNALKLEPNNPFLLLKMGQALTKTHYFKRAVAFYKDSIKISENTELRLHLADLYIQLREYHKAEVLLLSEIEAENSTSLEDLSYLQHRTKLLMLLSQTQEKSGNVNGALNTLKDAKDNQNRVRKRMAMEQKSVPESEIKLLLNILMKLAEISISLKNKEQAVQFYKDSLEISANNIETLVALAKIYMQMNLLEPCQQICSQILKIELENEAASVMMADIAFRKIDFDMALFHFTQLIIKQPTNWAALVRLVEITRRTGNLDDIPEYLANAEKYSNIPSKEPGLHFCTALFQWYSGNLNSALRNFNAVRQDNEWGQMALFNMIEICLNPNDEMLGDQLMDSDDNEYRDSRSMALKTADRLLKEYKQRLESSGEDMLKYKLLLNFSLLATQDKHNIERGLEEFIAIASQNAYKDHIGPILGMSTAYTLLKQTQRAKNQLKRVAKTIWTFEDAEYLERCWLLLADYYIQSTKFDVASDLLNRVVQHNKASSKAYELLGYICEKEQHYKDAIVNYENAWKFGGKTNPSVGFKLAYNLIKCKNYAEAIEIGQQVLKINPDYPKIRKDILDKSMNNLRV